MNKTSLVFHKKIKLKEQKPDVAKAIQTEYKTSAVISRILAARGYEVGKDLYNYINPSLKEGLDDPSKLKNLSKAADLIAKHVASKNSIAICSDFDVDGLTSGAQLVSFLDEIGVDAKIYVPDRFAEGYGLNTRMIDQAKESGASLLITVDYGTSNGKELLYAKEKGLDTIVIDHHHVPSDLTLPGDVFVNPQQEGCNFADGTLCTAGLCWYLLILLKKVIPEAKNIDVREYLDLASLGTICDMVPLVGVNRIIASKGLEYLTSSKRLGIKALKNIIGINGEVKSHNIGFGFGPRINAAGRMENGAVVVELFTTKDSIRAKKIATQLNKLNTKRQDVEKRIRTKVIKKVEQQDGLPHGIVAAGEDFHTGVIGIVAQRLVETFYRPSAVMGVDKGSYKGSVRGIPGFSVVEALEKLGDYFIKFGGHKGAGGFTLKSDNILEFEEAFNSVCKELLKDVELIPFVTADTSVGFEELDEILCNDFKKLSPFGVGNPSSQLLIKEVHVREVRLLKGSHLKVTFSDGKRYIDGLMWNTVRHPALFAGANVNIVCKPEVNYFAGNSKIQLILQAIEAV